MTSVFDDTGSCSLGDDEGLGSNMDEGILLVDAKPWAVWVEAKRSDCSVGPDDGDSGAESGAVRE